MFRNGGPSGLSKRDIVNLSSFIDLKKVLELRFLRILPDRVIFEGAMRDVYTVGSINISRTWQDGGMYGTPTSPGSWFDTHFHIYGKDVVTLKLHLATALSLSPRNLPGVRSTEVQQEVAAQYQREASEQSVLDDLVRRLGIDPHEPNVRQPGAFPGWTQVAWASASSPTFGRHAEEGDSGIWPKFRPDRVPVIGQPNTAFEIRDAAGRLQQIIGCWPTEWGTPLLLSFTLWQKVEDPLIQRWKFGRSAIKSCPYRIVNALENKAATIVIDDDILTVDLHHRELIKHHASGSPLVFVAWPRGMSGETPANTDWTPLRGRDVVVAVGHDRASFVHALELSAELLNAAAGSIEFVLPKDIMDEKVQITVDYKGGELRGSRKNAAEFALIAKEHFGIIPNTERSVEVSTSWKIGDEHGSLKSRPLMTPWLAKGTINVVYSQPGVGKSWFALLVTYALATGGKLLDRYQAQGRFRCLYLAGETPAQICQRIEQIHAAMPSCDGAHNIDVYPRPGQNNGRLNLEIEETWKVFDAMTDEADVIVIDHLSAFTVGHNSANSWSRIHSQLRRLTQRGKTILLLHHAGKNGQQRGTSILDDDIDMKIQMTSLADTENGALVTFEKHRDDETLGKSLKPFHLHWDKDANDLLQWWVADAEPSETKVWASPSTANNDPVRSVDQAFIVANFEGREADVILCLATAILEDKPTLDRRDIDRQLKISASNTRSVLGVLVSKGSVVVEGEAKSTRYALSPKVAESIIHE